MQPIQEDTTALLWDYYFSVKIPYLQSTSEDYLRIYGMPSTGNKQIDMEVANSWISTMANIATMVDHFKEGTPVRVVKQSDTKTIYDHISRHLENWKNKLQYGVNIGEAPIEDLIAMDRFANTVYEYAKYQFTPETISSLIGRDLSNVLGFTPSTFFTPGTVEVVHRPSDRLNTESLASSAEEGIGERDSMASFLKNSLGNLKRWR